MLRRATATIMFAGQAGAQLVEELIAKGYMERRPHPPGRSRTADGAHREGRACSRAAEAAITDTLRPSEAALGPEQLLPSGTTCSGAHRAARSNLPGGRACAVRLAAARDEAAGPPCRRPVTADMMSCLMAAARA